MQSELFQLGLQAVDDLEKVFERQRVVVVLQAQIGQLGGLGQRGDERLEVVARHAVDEGESLEERTTCGDEWNGLNGNPQHNPVFCDSVLTAPQVGSLLVRI